jgi:MFS family permease
MALHMTGFAMFQPLFALRFDSFGAGVAALSVSDMAYALTFAFAAPFTGMLADRFGRRPIILLSLAGYVLAFAGYLFAPVAWILITLRGLAGIFGAGLLPGMTSIVGDLAPENRRAQWIGIVNGGAAAGFIVGPSLGGLLYDRFGYVVPSAVSITMATGALLLALFRIPETHTSVAHPSRLRSPWTPGWQALHARSTFLLLMGITFGVMFAYAFIQPQFMFHAYDDLSWTSSQLGLVMSAYAVAFMFSAFAFGRLSDRLGRKPVLVLGLALFSAQFVGLVLFQDVAWIMVSFIIAGLGNALYDPALSAMILDITPPEHTAGMLGLNSMAGSLGRVLGPALVVLITPLAGPQVVFLAAAVLVCMVALASGLVLRLPGGIDGAHHLAEQAKP